MAKSTNDIAIDFLMKEYERCDNERWKLAAENQELRIYNGQMAARLLYSIPMLEYRQRTCPLS